ncbi:hypothetical protein AWENTII_002827 [Aspergillus wentii]
MDCVISRRRCRGRVSGCSTVERRWRRLMKQEMIGLGRSIGRRMVLQVYIAYSVSLSQLLICTGRGVLIDYATWAEKKGITYTTFSTHQVRLTDILEIARECNITFQKGDILFVRVGVTKEWDTVMTDEQKRAYSDNPSPEHAGVEASVDVLRWLWDTGFAAIASDAISWEVYPPQSPDLFLHEYVLAGWGMPIGELFDLEALARTCQELQRWSFFVTSVPLNMPGGVSSPPNVMAIF